MNYTKIKLTSQQEELKKALFLKLLSQLPHRVLLIINYLLKLQSKYGIAYPKQFTMGKKSKYSRQTINKWCGRLQRMGFFHMKYTHLEANIYSLHGVFFDPEFRRQIEQYLPSARFVPLMMLMAISLTHISNTSNVTNVTNKTTTRNLNDYHERWREIQWNESHCGGEERSPTKKLRYTYRDMEPFVDLLCDRVRKEREKEKYMEFTPEELQQLTQFSKQTIEYAQRVYNLDMQRGKQISNPFSYFYGICTRHKPNPSTGKSAVQAQSKTPPSSVAWKASTLAQDQYDRKVRIYNRQVKLYNAGYEYRNLEYGELYAMCVGQIHPKPLPFGTPPPDEPIYKEGLPVFWEEKVVTNPHELEETPILPIYGTKQQRPPLESQLPSQPINSFDEQYTPFVDAMYEGYEECLD